MTNDSFKIFLASMKSEPTKKVYTYSLKEFMKFVNIKNYDNVLKLKTKQIQKLLTNWVLHLSGKGLTAATIKSKLSAVELFLEMNTVIFHKKILHRLIPSDDYVPGGDIPFTDEEIQRMLNHTTKLRTKALIHFFASTGGRPGSLDDPVLLRKHLEEISNGCLAVKIYDGSRQNYWAFLTPEASKALRDYLSSRSLNREILTENSPIFANTSRSNRKSQAHLSSKSARQIIYHLIRNSGIERSKKGNRFDKAVVYGFRKRFNTILKLNNDVNSNIAEKLMAHKRGLDGAYFRPTKEQCFNEFVKPIPELTISDDARDKAKIAKLEVEKSEIKILKSQVSDLQKLRKKEDLVSSELVAFYETDDKNYLKNFPPEYLESWRMWKALKAKGQKVKKFSWPTSTIPEEIRKLVESN